MPLRHRQWLSASPLNGLARSPTPGLLACIVADDYGIDDGKWHLIYMISDEHIAERLLIKTQKPTPAPKCSSASSRRS
jgi:hypothetical protein